MLDKKSIHVLWIFDYLSKNKEITSTIIYDNLHITDRQLWRFIADIKKYLTAYTKSSLVYSKQKKCYYLVDR